MVVSGGQSPIRVVSKGSLGFGTGRRCDRRGLLLLKNGPLCLAVYGGRDLAGLPSADSHRGCRPSSNIEKGAAVLASGIRESLFSLIRAGS